MFLNDFDSIHLILLSKTFIKDVLFGTYIVLDKSSRVLQLSLHLSRLTIYG